MAATTPATLIGQPQRATLVGSPVASALLLADDLPVSTNPI